MKKIILVLMLCFLALPVQAQVVQAELTPESRAVLIAEIQERLTQLYQQLIAILMEQLQSQSGQISQNQATLGAVQDTLDRIEQQVTPPPPPPPPAPWQFAMIVETGTGVVGTPLHPDDFYEATDCDEPCEWPGGYTDRQFLYFTRHSDFDTAILYLAGQRNDAQSLTDFFYHPNNDRNRNGIVAWGALDPGHYSYQIVGTKAGYSNQIVSGEFTILEL